MPVDRNKLKYYFGVDNNSFVDETYLRKLEDQLDRLDEDSANVTRATVILERLDRIETQVFGGTFGDELDDLMVTEIRGIKVNYQKKMLQLYQLGFMAVQDLQTVVGIQAFNNKYAKLRSQASFRSA